MMKATIVGAGLKRAAQPKQDYQNFINTIKDAITPPSFLIHP
jgi:hypothetical protein